MNFKIHKDKNPITTITDIRKILTELNILVYENKWLSFTNNCCSVNLVSMDFPSYSTNGKGISKQYALASAYAEFMERLQTDFLIRKKFGLMENEDFKYPDEIDMPLGLYTEENRYIIDYLLDTSAQENFKDYKITCTPFFDIVKGKIKMIPYFYRLACGSNGLCSGNTPEEALCQGICEIFERHVVREIYFNKKLEIPTIPLSALKKLEIYSIIEELINNGYNLVIKDCTLGGKIPVVGVILTNKDFYNYAFGSDPIFEVAIQRCLTEMFQGKGDALSFKKDFFKKKINFSSDQFLNKKFLSEEENLKYNFSESLISNDGDLPNRIFISNKETINFHTGFQEKFKSHKDSLKFLTDIIKQNDYNLYIRDLSALGFKSFRVFIPELSVVNKIAKEKFRAHYVESNFIKSVLLRLKKSSTEDIQKCADLLEPLMNLPQDVAFCKSLTCRSIVNIIIDESSHFKQFDHLAYLLGMLFFRVGHFEKSFKYLDIYLKEEKNNVGNLDYYSGVLLYLKLKSEKYPENEINLTLKNILGEKLTQRVISSLAVPEDCFKYFILPECGECFSCPIQKECKYEKWNEVNTKIIHKIHDNPIDQKNLADIFIN